jgi:hypothetical protein
MLLVQVPPYLSTTDGVRPPKGARGLAINIFEKKWWTLLSLTGTVSQGVPTLMSST